MYALTLVHNTLGFQVHLYSCAVSSSKQGITSSKESKIRLWGKTSILEEEKGNIYEAGGAAAPTVITGHQDPPKKWGLAPADSPSAGNGRRWENCFKELKVGLVMEEPPTSTAGILAGTGMPVYCSQLLEIASSAWLATPLSRGSRALWLTAALLPWKSTKPHGNPPGAFASHLAAPWSAARSCWCCATAHRLQKQVPSVSPVACRPAPVMCVHLLHHQHLPYGWAARDHFSSTLPLLFLPGQACF